MLQGHSKTTLDFIKTLRMFSFRFGNREESRVLHWTGRHTASLATALLTSDVSSLHQCSAEAGAHRSVVSSEAMTSSAMTPSRGIHSARCGSLSGSRSKFPRRAFSRYQHRQRPAVPLTPCQSLSRCVSHRQAVANTVQAHVLFRQQWTGCMVDSLPLYTMLNLPPPRILLAIKCPP